MNLARQMGIARIAIGAAALLTPRMTSRLMGFPTEHDNPTARLMGRLFGVRDVILGVLVLTMHDDPRIARSIYQLNAAVDAGDAASMATAIIGRQGIDRAALSSAALAVPAAFGWIHLAKEAENSPV
jgi:hypothetical protein